MLSPTLFVLYINEFVAYSNRLILILTDDGITGYYDSQSIVQERWSQPLSELEEVQVIECGRANLFQFDATKSPFQHLVQSRIFWSYRLGSKEYFYVCIYESIFFA